MYEIDDGLPALGADPERLALVQNQDLIEMIKLGRASTPLDLMSYSPEDNQPSIFWVAEDDRQGMLTIFNGLTNLMRAPSSFPPWAYLVRISSGSPLCSMAKR